MVVPVTVAMITAMRMPVPAPVVVPAVAPVPMVAPMRTAMPASVLSQRQPRIRLFVAPVGPGASTLPVPAFLVVPPVVAVASIRVIALALEPAIGQLASLHGPAILAAAPVVPPTI